MGNQFPVCVAESPDVFTAPGFCSPRTDCSTSTIVTTVGTGVLLGSKAITGRGDNTLVAIIAHTIEGSSRASSRTITVSTNTTVVTTMGTCVGLGACTTTVGGLNTLHTVFASAVVLAGSTRGWALTVSSGTAVITAIGTSVLLGTCSIAIDGVGTLHSVTAKAVVLPRSTTSITFTPCLCRACGRGAVGVFVVDFHICKTGVVTSTEVIATGAACIASCTTAEAIANIAIGTGCQVGLEVMSTTPCRTIAAVVVLVVTIAIPTVFVVVGQREEEVGAVTGVTVTSTP